MSESAADMADGAPARANIIDRRRHGARTSDSAHIASEVLAERRYTLCVRRQSRRSHHEQNGRTLHLTPRHALRYAFVALRVHFHLGVRRKQKCDVV